MPPHVASKLVTNLQVKMEELDPLGRKERNSSDSIEGSERRRGKIAPGGRRGKEVLGDSMLA